MSAAAENVGQRTILESALAAIAAAPLQSRPFAHVTLERVFPESVYGEMLANLPPLALYGEQLHKDAMLASGKSTRLRFELESDSLARLPARQGAFWREVAEQMGSDELEHALKSKFEVALRKRFGADPERIEVRRRVVLFKDIGGYKISVHADNTDKVVTTQFYLPTDESQVHLGTSFHERDGKEGFRKVRSVPFRPNSGYSFPVTPDSWHSVEQLQDNDRERNTLMVIYYQRGGMQRIRSSLRGVLRAVKRR